MDDLVITFGSDDARVNFCNMLFDVLNVPTDGSCRYEYDNYGLGLTMSSGKPNTTNVSCKESDFGFE